MRAKPSAHPINPTLSITTAITVSHDQGSNKQKISHLTRCQFTVFHSRTRHGADANLAGLELPLLRVGSRLWCNDGCEKPAFTTPPATEPLRLSSPRCNSATAPRNSPIGLGLRGRRSLAWAKDVRSANSHLPRHSTQSINQINRCSFRPPSRTRTDMTGMRSDCSLPALGGRGRGAPMDFKVRCPVVASHHHGHVEIPPSRSPGKPSMCPPQQGRSMEIVRIVRERDH
jgi:hypothetical protein